MDTTSLTRLDRLKAGDLEGWTAFPLLYAPFIRGQLRRMLSNPADVDEVEQEVLLVLFEKVKSFERQREGSFRSFVRKISYFKGLELLGKLAAGRLPQGTSDGAIALALQAWADPSSNLSRIWDADHRMFVMQQILCEARRRCGEKKVSIFCELKKKELTREAIAEQFNVSLATLFRIQSEVNRVLEQIRLEYGDLLDLDDLTG